jgi:catechol 2,3-dioxygenase-like lactoylglutathione lyase family enzyme
MKRLHVHVSVEDIGKSIGFYSALFAAKPVVVKGDYAKWMLDDPRVNFAISMRGNALGLDHLGIQVESGEELQEVYGRLRKAGNAVLEVGATTCCYAKWETFLTSGESTVYGDSSKEKSGEARIAHTKSCCAPSANAVAEKVAL